MRLLAVCAAAIALTLGGCQQSDRESKTVFVLFDLTASTKASEVRSRYFSDFQKLLGNMAGGDILVADRITDNPLAQSTFPVNETFDAMNKWTDNPLQWKREAKERKERIESTVKEMVFDTKKRYRRTSIVDALHLAQRVFATYPNGRQVLVLFSDMVEESSYYDFTGETFDEPRIAQVLETERSEKRLPNLDGVQVYVIGASAGYYSRMDPAKVRQIQNFWFEYFQACGANLPMERYGSGLILPPE